MTVVEMLTSLSSWHFCGDKKYCIIVWSCVYKYNWQKMPYGRMVHDSGCMVRVTFTICIVLLVPKKKTLFLITIAAIKNGNENTFQEVFYSYHHKLYAYVLGKTHSQFLAEEVTQLTFIKLWQYRAHLNEELSINVQLFRIAKTTLIDALRKEARKPAVYQMSTASEAVSEAFLEANIYHKELSSKLELAINKMPAARRNVFRLSRFDGLSYKEIAERLSLSTKTVEHHIALALKQLRHFLTLLVLLLFFAS